jgi:GNAT superfamily N-acetyltransferase
MASLETSKKTDSLVSAISLSSRARHLEKAHIGNGPVWVMPITPSISAKILPLTQGIAVEHADALCDVHNLIPMVEWTPSDLLADEISGRYFDQKWRLSRIAIEDNEPIGLMVAFQEPCHEPGESQPCVYLHRLAVRADRQGLGLGSNLLATLTRMAPVLSTNSPSSVVTQTNTSPANRSVSDFYRSRGFQVVGFKAYPHKCDFVLRCPVSSVSS